MTLWTPDGERKIPPKADADQAPPDAADEVVPPGAEHLSPGDPTPDDLSPEDAERARAMAHELAEARARLLETEVSTVLANHALGIYELGAIHLTADEPNFEEAKLAIDALAALVEGVKGRLGEPEATLTEALHQVRMAYVQRLKEASEPAEAPGADSGS